MSELPDDIAKLKELIARMDREYTAEIAKRDQRSERLAQRVALLESFLRRALRGRFIPSAETVTYDPAQQRLDLLGTTAPAFPLPPLADIAEGVLPALSRDET